MQQKREIGSGPLAHFVWVALFWFVGFLIIAATGGSVGAWTLLVLGLTIAAIARGLKVAESDPPTAVLIMPLKRPPGRTRGPGVFFHWPWEYLYPLPFGEQALEVDLEEPVVTKDGAQVDVELFARFRLNLENAYRVVIVGGYDGVVKRLRELMEAAVRQYAATVTWQEFMASKVEATRHLYERIVELEEGDLEDGRVKDSLIHDDREERHDAQSLGIIISRLSVTRVTPTARLREVIDRVIEEKRQREAERVDQNTRKKLAQELVEEARRHGETISYAEAFALVTDWEAIRSGHGSVTRHTVSETVVRALVEVLRRGGLE